MNPWLQCGIFLAVAAVVTMLCVPFATWLANKTGAIDYPNARRVNTKPIPRLGGVAMFMGLVAALIVLALGIFCWNWDTPFGPHWLLDDVNYFLLGVGVLVMFVVGLADDIKSLNPKVKLLGQILAACLAASSGLLLVGMNVGGQFVDFGWVAWPITVVYLVAFANIINLIDGLDGLASGIVTISSLAIMIVALIQGQYAAAFLCAALIGSCLGFLRYNFHPASIFMGDSGALSLGFLMGIISLLATAKSAMLVSILIPVVAAAIPVLDTLAAIIRRVRGHRPIDEADKGHLHHRLLELGYSQREVTLIMWAWTAAFSVCSVALVFTSGWANGVVWLVIVGLCVFILTHFKILHPVQVHGYDNELKDEAGEGEGEGAGEDESVEAGEGEDEDAGAAEAGCEDAGEGESAEAGAAGEGAADEAVSERQGK